MHDDVAFHVLRELDQNQGPTGSWRVCAALNAAGIETSETTAGRLLRELDLRGLTQPFGSKGRVLTEKGRVYLAQLEQLRHRNSLHEDLVQAVRTETIDDLLDLLNARRAVEVEAARLAALHATEEDIERLQEAIHQHIEIVKRDGSSVEQSFVIRRLIAQASRSRILQAMVNLILEELGLHKVQVHIQVVTKGLVPQNFDLLLRAIRDKDPDRAAEVMRAHIDRLIALVRGYSVRSSGDSPIDQTPEARSGSLS